MNASELYDYDVSTPTATATANGGTTSTTNEPSVESARPTLNEEVQQALGVLGGFWSGFRKQSSNVIAGARKDFGSVVEQAQKELGKLSTVSDAAVATQPSTSIAATEGVQERKASSEIASKSLGDEPQAPATAPGATTSDEAVAPVQPEPSEPKAAATSAGASSFFSFIQSSLPPTLAQNLATAPSTIQSTFQRTMTINPEEQLSHLRENLSTNLAHLQTSVQSNATIQQLQQSVQTNANQTFQQLSQSVQNLNLNPMQEQVRGRATEAGSIVKSVGEEFWKGAGDFFREAVKIVPPEEEEARGLGIGAGVGAFDGLDMWAFDDLGGDVGDNGEEHDKGKGKASGEDPSLGGFAVSRTAALLKQLRSDPELLRADPETSHASEGEPGNKSSFGWFVEELEKRGGSVGSEGWIAKCANEEEMFEELQGVKKLLVPNEMDETTFWKRYWFRAWQIKQAEEKRKALLQATMTAEKEDEDFTWEDDEEETTPQRERTPLDRSTSTLEPTARAEPSGLVNVGEEGKETNAGTATTTTAPSSPSKESEESYDLVSTRSGNASGTTLAVPGLKAVHETKVDAVNEKKEGKDEEEDEDSDWE
ncbi:hypothetical protein FRC14_006756 [Serendipita sp. 396]|nr:hypothetical protein FRC14_006756 [Serendipita sp. 396]KAG8798818.1 hypothetical protein FRC16_006484 [Serendipita sp. 398]